MENIKVPEWVKRQLSGEEKVISRLSHGMADYYATDKRLLRFRSKTDYHALEYSQVSINLVKAGTGWSVIRIFTVLFGLLCIGLGTLGFIGPTFHNGTTITHTQAPLEYCFLFWVLGLVMIVLALNFRYAYYQIESPDFDNEDLKKWRIQRSRWGSAKLDRFARIVKERSDGSTT